MFTFDDEGLVFNNPMASPQSMLLSWFSRPSATGSLYRPLTMVTYGLNHLVSPDPFGYHLVNILLHATTTLVAYELATSLLRSRPAGFATALFFAVHPVHTEAVSSVAGRAEVIAGLMVLLALLGFAYGTERRSLGWYVVSLVAFAAGLFAKENAFVALPLLALTAVWLEGRTFTKQLRVLVPYIVLAIGGLLARSLAVGSLTLLEPPPFVDNPLAYVTVGTRLKTALVVLCQYLGTLLVPIRLSADESFNQVPVVSSVLDTRFLVAAGVLFAATVLVTIARKRAPALFGAVFLATALLVTANVAFPIGTLKAERLLYLPSFGWCLVCGWLARNWCGSAFGRRHLAIALVLAALATRTWVRNTDWHDNFTLFTRTATASPDSARAHANAAAMYGNAREFDAASFHYKQALRIYPSYAAAALGLGQAYEVQGKNDRALRWYARAEVLEPNQSRSYLRLGSLLTRLGRTADARSSYLAGLRRLPGDGQLQAALAEVDPSLPPGDHSPTGIHGVAD